MKHQENVREFYRRQGEERERQRILKPLEKLVLDYPAMNFDDLIALIEGDTIETGRLR